MSTYPSPHIITVNGKPHTVLSRFGKQWEVNCNETNIRKWIKARKPEDEKTI